jgi:hypothetical protein
VYRYTEGSSNLKQDTTPAHLAKHRAANVAGGFGLARAPRPATLLRLAETFGAGPEGGGGGEVCINRSTYHVKPFYLSSQTVLPIESNRSTYQLKPFYP